ncbi:MAG: glycoside hydrolase family 127 protein [Brachybacterium sp.]|uniref:glycoside hydrolase family 127 protein n=1 Tax=Brachybacterium sp. TaxID=1891286 RepID=UPI002648376A|nr:beta-L-arabinofuranosidase domain-containing protein [Brachybacterium sp.]MDN5688323.1 glycoside hydrolase family 127 protein [Brachybacterium sp.]
MTTAPNALAAPAIPTGDAEVAQRPLAAGDARITGGFWHTRQQRNRRAGLRSGYQQLEASGTFRNFRIVGGAEEGEASGMIFQDSDVYKWLEAVAVELGREDDRDLRAMAQEVTGMIASAQQEDGYLNSVHTLRHPPEERYTVLAWNHELYCYGHLIQAAVALARNAGETELLDVSLRIVDHLESIFGPQGRAATGGHPVIEMALVELFRLTGREDIKDLARFFLDVRGREERFPGAHPGPGYFSADVPVRETVSVEGHAVRALYLFAGATDQAIEDGDGDLLARTEAVFADLLATKTYVTGGMGARWDWEAFGDPYEMTTDRGYAETCAAIGAIQWAWRLLLATGKGLYADAVERLLFNAFLAGVSLAGTEYFYVNSLQLREGAKADEGRSIAHGRRGWFDCACCPPNIMRTFASLDHLVATETPDGLAIHQFTTGTWSIGQGPDRFTVSTETSYPHDGLVRLRIEEAPDAPRRLSLRIPSWSRGTATLTRSGADVPLSAADDYASIEATFPVGEIVELRLDLTPRFVGVHHRLDASRGAVALERGPLVYAIENEDQGGAASVDDAAVDSGAVPEPRAPITALDGAVPLAVSGSAVAVSEAAAAWPYPVHGTADVEVTRTPTTWTAIPYYAWGNRSVGPMRVWLPLEAD